MTHDEMIEILVAHRNKRRVQFRNAPGPWQDYTGNCPPDFLGEWRITPGLVCKTRLQVCGFPLYVEGGPENAKRLEREFNRRTYQMVAEFEPLPDDSPREEFELRPA